MNRSISCLAVLVLLGFASTAKADECSQEISFRLAPQSARSLSICSIGDAIVAARTDGGEDIDLDLYLDLQRIASDTALDGMPIVVAEAEGYNEYDLVVTNASDEYVQVLVIVR